MSTTTGRSASGKSDEEVALEAIQNMESLSRNYVPIINPSNRKPMLQLKKHGECTLVDPRACFAHYRRGSIRLGVGWGGGEGAKRNESKQRGGTPATSAPRTSPVCSTSTSV